MRLLRKRNDRAPGWHSNRQLSRAIASTGLRDLEFVLVAVDVAYGEAIALTFLPAGSVPQGKEHEAGLALRCVVGLTFPAIAADAGFEVRLDSPGYTVALGDGVRMPAHWVRSAGATVLGPLQVTHDYGGGRWHVSVQPLGFALADALDPSLQLLREGILAQIASAFETRKGDHVRL